MLATIYSLPTSLIQQYLFRANEFYMFEGYNHFILPKDVQLASIVIAIDYSYSSFILVAPLTDNY